MPPEACQETAPACSGYRYFIDMCRSYVVFRCRCLGVDVPESTLCARRSCVSERSLCARIASLTRAKCTLVRRRGPWPEIRACFLRRSAGYLWVVDWILYFAVYSWVADWIFWTVYFVSHRLNSRCSLCPSPVVVGFLTRARGFQLCVVLRPTVPEMYYVELELQCPNYCIVNLRYVDVNWLISSALGSRRSLFECFGRL